MDLIPLGSRVPQLPGSAVGRNLELARSPGRGEARGPVKATGVFEEKDLRRTLLGAKAARAEIGQVNIEPA